jgi:hypothetical protein
MGFFDILTNMDETIAAKKSEETLMSGLKRILILLVIIGIIAAIITALSGSIIGAVIAFVLILIGGIIMALVGLFVSWISARIVGGSGSFGQHVGVSTLILFPGIVLCIPLILLYAGMILLTLGSIVTSAMAAVPNITNMLSLGIGAIVIALIMYFLLGIIVTLFTYFNVIFLKQVHSISTWRTAISVGLSFLIMMIIMLAIGGLLFVSIMSVRPF